MKTWIIGLLLIQGAWAKPIKLPSRIISHKLCFNCYSCTGLFLNAKTLLTAAHCAEKPIWDQYEIKISNRTLKHWDDPSLVRTNALTLHLNPQYNPQTRYHDLMVIKFKKNIVKFPADSLPPQFVTDNELEGAFWTIGFGGKTRKMREMPLNLRASSSRLARLAFGHVNEYRTCFGDSGGPTYIQQGNEAPKLVSIVSGITSKKADEVAYNCSPQHYSIHTWLYPHLDWVKSFLEER